MGVIEVQKLYKAYGSHVAVRDISFTVQEGEIFGIIGPNGAGKTTTVECIEGLRQPDGGSISVLGFDPQHQRDDLRKQLGVQTQASTLPDKIRVWEALDLFSALYPNPADWRKLLDDLELGEKRNAFIHQLSGGQQQRVSLALALIGQPRIAVLDELTTGLDPQARRDVWDMIQQIRDRGITIVLVTHFMDEAQSLCDRIAVIDAGQIVAIDSPAGLIARAGTEQRMHFRPSHAFADSLLTSLPEVQSVQRQGAHVVVTGDGNLVYAVTAALAQQGITAEALQVKTATLDEAFGLLTRQGNAMQERGAA